MEPETSAKHSSRRYDAVGLDLGNTLATYFSRAQWPGVLDQAIAEVCASLRARGLLRCEGDELARRVQAARGERDDQSVRPLLGRLATIFSLSQEELAGELGQSLSRSFCRPIFASARLCDDTLAALKALRSRGMRVGILSNTPWGTPGALWREHLDELGLSASVDVVSFCTDCGYRKPARQAFEHFLDRLGAPASRCLFVGDDPRWDLAGPRAMGMDAVVIDRLGEAGQVDATVIRSLAQLESLL